MHLSNEFPIKVATELNFYHHNPELLFSAVHVNILLFFVSLDEWMCNYVELCLTQHQLKFEKKFWHGYNAHTCQ